MNTAIIAGSLGLVHQTVEEIKLFLLHRKRAKV
jgi:hypothetical protein